MHKIARLLAFSLLTALVFAVSTSAQTRSDAAGVSAPRSNGDTATVSTNAPIFLLPDSGREPLRIASTGSTLRIIGQSEGWYNVQFQDPQFGLRTGFIESKNVSVRRRELEPMDLSVVPQPDPAQPAPTRGRQAPAPPRVSSRAPVEQQRSVRAAPPAEDLPNSTRPQGFWFNVGLGVGSLGCKYCDSYTAGGSGGLVFGGRINDKWLYGVGTTGFVRTFEGSDTLSVGTLDALFRFYPSRKSGLFLTMGLGVGSISVNALSEYGTAAVLGLGWDVRAGRRISLTPFWNGFAVSTSSGGDANVGQIGLGITVH